VLVEVTFVGGTRDVYFLPMGIVHGEEAVRLYETMRPWVIARLHGAEQDGVLFDALADDSICTAFLTAIGEARTATLQQGTVGASPTSVFGQLTGGAPTPLPVVRGPATSSNSIVFFGRRLLLKLFRRLERGINPDYEVGRFLTERHQFRRIPQVAGSLEYRPSENDQPYSLGILQAFVANQGDGWRHAIDELSRYYERASARMYAPDQLEPEPRPLTELIHAPPPPVALETIATYLYAAATLGRRTAEMHLAMAADPGEPAFAPEPLTGADMDSLRKEIDHQRQLAFSALSDNLSRLPLEVENDVIVVDPQHLAQMIVAVDPRLGRLRNPRPPGGQVIEQGRAVRE
jgi:maltose alpha-D-glucosyltransferase/alpha-amylase